MMMTIYCLSGLGADHRIFSRLQASSVRLVHLEWILPHDRNERLQDYAKRLAENIHEDRPVLMGVSFGGMMAMEMAKLIDVRAVILISSIPTCNELPSWMKLFGKWRADYLLPKKPLGKFPVLKLFRPLQNYFLGAHDKASQEIANEFRNNVNPVYLRWSITHILNWKNSKIPSKLYHVHGDRDKLFPDRLVHPTHRITGAGHFMIYTHAKQVDQILEAIALELR